MKQEAKEEKRMFSILYNYASKHRRNFLLTIIALLVNTALTVSAPIFFVQAIAMVEDVIVNSNTIIVATLIFALSAYFILTLISWLSGAAIAIFTTRLNAGIIRDLRQDVFKSLLDNSMTFFDQTESGNLVSVVTNDLNELYSTGSAIAEVLTSAFRLVGVIILLFYYSVPLTFASLLLLPIFFMITMFIRKYRRNSERAWRESFGQVNHSFAETLRSIEVSKAFNQEEKNIEGFKILNETTYKASIKRGAAIFISRPIADFLKNVLLIMILTVGVYLVTETGLTIAVFYLFIFLMDFYYEPVRTIARNYNQFQSLFANLERIIGISHFGSDQETNHNLRELDQFTGAVEFRNLDFSYDDTNRVLENISFKINSGSRVALVGHTGSGKTTIAALLMKYYSHSVGEILLDGKSISDYSTKSIRKNISIVSQDVLLFKGSIRDNLMIADPEATDDDLWESINAVQAHEFIEDLPHGLNTMISEDAKNISSGQRQMISFARTLLSKPKLILLDEATSSVDLYTEAKIQKSTDLLLKETTSLVIAHRLTTILRSDLIVVLDNGRIIETGTHESLIANDGMYKEMFELYFKTQSAEYLEKVKRY